MLIVAPTGNTKRVTRLSIPMFSSRHLNVIGKVAELNKAEFRPKEKIPIINVTNFFLLFHYSIQILVAKVATLKFLRLKFFRRYLDAVPNAVSKA